MNGTGYHVMIIIAVLTALAAIGACLRHLCLHVILGVPASTGQHAASPDAITPAGLHAALVSARLAGDGTGSGILW